MAATGIKEGGIRVKPQLWKAAVPQQLRHANDPADYLVAVVAFPRRPRPYSRGQRPSPTRWICRNCPCKVLQAQCRIEKTCLRRAQSVKRRMKNAAQRLTFNFVITGENT
jgi:hypothetical protein